MTWHVFPGRLCGLVAFLSVLLLGGCSRKPPRPEPAPVPAPGGDASAGAPAPPVQPGGGPTTERSPKGGGVPDRAPEASAVRPPLPLSEAERQELAELRGWAKRAEWSWERDVSFKRQRPAGLIVLRPGGDLTETIPTALEYARGTANASWDVKVLLLLTGADRHDLEPLKRLRAGVGEINKAIDARNGEDGPARDVAPLRPIEVRAVVVRDAKELERIIDGWTAQSFCEGQSSSKGAPVSRAPFGGISFSGHGRSALIDPKKKASPQNAVPQFMVTETEWFDLSRLEALVLREYQAPVWLFTDLCRTGSNKSSEPTADLRRTVTKLEPRAFENLSDLSDWNSKAVSECEALRANTPAGFRHRDGAGATTLYATHELYTIDHKRECLLHAHLGAMLTREEPRDPEGPRFTGFVASPAPTASVTLARAKSWAADQLLAKKIDPENQRPTLCRGTFSDQTVVFSALRGKDVYQPQFPNLLGGGVSLEQGEFTVPELTDDPGSDHYGAVTVIRKQKKFDGDGFKAVFRFKQPYSLAPGRHYQLVLLVSASGADPAHSIRFTTGVYDTEYRLLNTSFTEYGTAESYRAPVKCDRSLRLIHVPLARFNSPADPKSETNPRPEVAAFEVQAAPDQPEANWKADGGLNVHAVYLLPMAVTDGDLKADAERAGARASLGQMCVWDVPLHARPEAVLARPYEKGVELKQSVPGHAGLWGAAGAIYPKLYAEAGGQQVRVKIEAEAGAAIKEAAEVCVYVCSNKRIMAVWKAPLAGAVKKEQVIPITTSGLTHEIVVAVQHHAGPIRITQLELENVPAAK